MRYMVQNQVEVVLPTRRLQLDFVTEWMTIHSFSRDEP